MVLLKVLFFVVVIVFVKWFVLFFLRGFNKVNVFENIMIVVMVFCFGFLFLVVKLGMSDVLGVYIVGLVILEICFKV